MSETKRQRPTFTTTIDRQVQDDFRTTCKANKQTMSDVLETFMKAYSDGALIIESKTSFTLKKK